MISEPVASPEPDARFQSQQAEPRNLEAMSVELQRRLEDASRALEGLKAHQATSNALLRQFQSDFDSILTLSREMKEVVDQKAEEPLGVVATLQAAVEKTRDTVIGRVEHVREQAVAAIHRLKADPFRAEGGGGEQANPPSTKDADRRGAG
jgi:hypothetical protein